jgi:hypothetical protein
VRFIVFILILKREDARVANPSKKLEKEKKKGETPYC